MRISAEQRDRFAALRQFVRSAPTAEAHCDLCAMGIGQEHSHLLESATRRIICSCNACAILFSNQTASQSGTGYRRIPTGVRLLTGSILTDAQWDALALPINIAYFLIRANSSTPTAFYPSPAGATESLLALDAWRDIVGQNPTLQTMETEVEALLVNRMTKPCEYYLVPIDECYRLVGLIRSKWTGLSGGKEVWQVIGEFFVSLRKRSTYAQMSHA